jgi:hypothetical protein
MPCIGCNALHALPPSDRMLYQPRTAVKTHACIQRNLMFLTIDQWNPKMIRLYDGCVTFSVFGEEWPLGLRCRFLASIFTFQSLYLYRNSASYW